MILGVMSDTHGNGNLMHQVAAFMTNHFKADVIYHLGDDYCDALELLVAGYNVRRVPGLWCAEYHDAQIPKRLIDECDGITVACAHADKDLRHTERAAAVILTGHTHSAQIAILGRSLYVNPGHLKNRTSRGRPASYAIVEITPATVNALIVELNGTVRFKDVVERSRLA